tara:strand:- start:2365 stop:3273 length:909 start_codon:yes stop_codon:yes gene_type:complete
MTYKVKLGISLRSLARDASDFADRIGEVATFNPDSIELSCFAQDLIMNGSVITDRVTNMKSILNEYSIKSTMHGPLTFNLLDPTENIQSHINTAESYLELGAMLGVTAMVLHTGFCPNMEPPKLAERYDVQREGLYYIAQRAQSRGLTIYLENIFPFYDGAHTALPSKLASELLEINHTHLKGCFDVSHGYIACTAYNADLVSEVKQISPLSPHWHVHDSFGKPTKSLEPYTHSESLSYGIGDLHLAVGHGSLPWNDVLNAATITENAVFNIELHPELWSDLDICIANTRELIDAAGQKGKF